MIPESWDRVPHRAPSSAGSLLLPLTLSPLMLFLSLSKKKKKKVFSSTLEPLGYCLNLLGKRSQVKCEQKALVAEASLYPVGRGALTNFKFLSIPRLSDGFRKWWGWCVYNGGQLLRN